MTGITLLYCPPLILVHDASKTEISPHVLSQTTVHLETTSPPRDSRCRIRHTHEVNAETDPTHPVQHSVNWATQHGPTSDHPNIENFAMSMSKIIADAREYCLDEDGTTAVEYAVMLALIVALCTASVTVLASRTRDSFDESGEAIAGALNN